MDPMNNIPAMLDMADLARKAGGEAIVAALTFTLSPRHDDAYFTAAAQKLALSGKFDRLYLKDPGGLVTPQRAVTLIPALKAAVGALPLEFHSHCTIALAQFSYLEAAQRGAETLHVAAAAAANGTSQPAALTTVRNLRDLGLAVDVDDEGLQEMDAYFTALTSAEGLSHGQPQEFDGGYFRHQMPGGMMGTLKRQLAETRRSHLLPKVLEEAEQVRADLGYPIMVTLFSQVVATQALLNVVDGERYKTIPDEVARYIHMQTLALIKRLWDMSAALPGRFRCSVFEYRPYPGTPDWTRLKGDGYSEEQMLNYEPATLDYESVECQTPERDEFNFSTGLQFGAVPIHEVKRNLADIMKRQSLQ